MLQERCAGVHYERGSSSFHPMMSTGLAHGAGLRSSLVPSSTWVGEHNCPPGSYPLLLGTLRAGPVTSPAQPSALEGSTASQTVNHFRNLCLRALPKYARGLLLQAMVIKLAL